MTQIPDLPFQRLEPLPVVARQTYPEVLVTLRLPDPAPQHFRRAADLPRDRDDRSLLRGVIALVVEHYSNCALANLRGIFRHGSILSRNEASGKPDAVRLSFIRLPWPHYVLPAPTGVIEQRP